MEGTLLKQHQIKVVSLPALRIPGEGAEIEL